MVKTEGVPLDRLYCPTCGTQIRSFVAQVDPEDFDVMQVAKPITAIVARSGKPYLRCPKGHKWTIKTIWRIQGQVDHVLLGEYLGDD